MGNEMSGELPETHENNALESMGNLREEGREIWLADVFRRLQEWRQNGGDG
jgi:hypothetical protein